MREYVRHPPFRLRYAPLPSLRSSLRLNSHAGTAFDHGPVFRQEHGDAVAANSGPFVPGNRIARQDDLVFVAIIHGLPTWGIAGIPLDLDASGRFYQSHGAVRDGIRTFR